VRSDTRCSGTSLGGDAMVDAVLGSAPAWATWAGWLPTIYSTDELVRAGGLMGYGADLRTMYRHGAAHTTGCCAAHVRPSCRSSSPTRFELVIDLRAARALGLTMPNALLLRADDLID
jgi:putative tryptophan/tyrosine transport system substrate-binding protein